MTQQRIDFVVHYLVDDKVRKKVFWIEKDARTFANKVDATRIERISNEILWEIGEGELDPSKPQPKSTRIEPTGYLS